MAAPDIERTFATSHATLAALLFVGPGVVALCLEPVVFLLADRHPRAWFVRGGLTVMAFAALAAAVAPGPVWLAAALAVSWVATGAGVSLAQATLLDAAPATRARTMARWTLMSLVGDLLTPALLAGLAAAGVTGHWRVAYLIVAIVLGAWAVLTWLTPIPHAVGPEPAPEPGPEPALEPAPAGPAEGSADEPFVLSVGRASASPESKDAPAGLWASLREALRDRVLIAWLFGLALCDLLDEILVVFAALHVRDVLGGGPVAQGAVIGASMLGGALGLVVLERLLVRRGERELLIACGLACAAAFTAWLLAPTVWLSAALMLVVGATATPLYPLVAAQAFARRPAASGSVLAASHLFTPLGLALPWLLGLVADRAGTHAALALLLVEPLGLVVLAIATDPRRRGHPAAP